MHQVLTAGDDAVGLEQLEEDADDIALHKARRSMGSMSAMSGANGMVYMEYRYNVSIFLLMLYFFVWLPCKMAKSRPISEVLFNSL